MAEQEEKDNEEANLANHRSGFPDNDRVLPSPPPSTPQRICRDSTITAREQLPPGRLPSLVGRSPSLSNSKPPIGRFKSFQRRRKRRPAYCRFSPYACPCWGECFFFITCLWHPWYGSSILMSMEQAARPFAATYLVMQSANFSRGFTLAWRSLSLGIRKERIENSHGRSWFGRNSIDWEEVQIRG